MRARNREINIFNMSLLDILCGALGAFCFMMIVLLPYYKPGTGADAKNQKELEETLKDIDKLKEKIKDAELAKELAELIEKLKKQIQELEGRVNSLVAENQKLQQQINDLAARNKQLENENKQLRDKADRLDWREPFIVEAALDVFLPQKSAGIIDLYLWQDSIAADGKSKQPPFDPAKAFNNIFWTGDQSYWFGGRDPRAVWLARDVPYGQTWRIYAKLALTTMDEKDPKKWTPVAIPEPIGILISLGCGGLSLQSLPAVPLSAEHPWALVGFATADKSDVTKVTARLATTAEREAEWKAIGKKKN